MNHELHGFQILPWEGAILRGETGEPLLGHPAVICANTAEPIEVAFGLWARMRPRHHVLDGGPDPPWEGAILADRGAHSKVYALYFCRELCKNG